MIEVVFFIIVTLLMLVICYNTTEMNDKLSIIIDKLNENSQEKNLTDALSCGMILEDIEPQRSNNEIKLFNPEKY